MAAQVVILADALGEVWKETSRAFLDAMDPLRGEDLADTTASHVWFA